MRVAVTSDWHIQNSHQFARPLPDKPWTTRAQWVFDFMQWLKEYCKESEIQAVLHCGDFFTQKNNIPVPIFNEAYRLMEDFGRLGVWFVVIPGNHDRYRNEHKVHSIETFDRISRVLVLDEADPIVSLTDASVEVFGVPGGCSLGGWDKWAKKYPRILLLHENVVGAKFPSGKTVDEGMSLKNIKDTMRGFEIDLCFVGDNHKPQVMGSSGVYSVGAPYQMDFGDAEQERGIWVFDTEGLKPEFVNYEEGPHFMTINDQNLDPILDLKTEIWPAPKIKNCFWRFQLTKQRNLEYVQNYMRKRDDFVIDFSSAVVSRNGDGVVLDDPKEAVVEYVDEQGVNEYDKREQLINLGWEYLKKVAQEVE